MRAQRRSCLRFDRALTAARIPTHAATRRYDKTVPAILEIPSKEHPYAPSKDSVLAKVQHLFSDSGDVSG